MKNPDLLLDRMSRLFAERFANDPVLADRAVSRLALLLQDLDGLRGSPGLLQLRDFAGVFLLVQEMHRLAQSWASTSHGERRAQFLELVAAARVQHLARERRAEIRSRRVTWTAAILGVVSVFGTGASMAGAADDLHAIEFPIDLPDWIERLLWPAEAGETDTPGPLSEVSVVLSALIGTPPSAGPDDGAAAAVDASAASVAEAADVTHTDDQQAQAPSHQSAAPPRAVVAANLPSTKSHPSSADSQSSPSAMGVRRKSSYEEQPGRWPREEGTGFPVPSVDSFA